MDSECIFLSVMAGWSTLKQVNSWECMIHMSNTGRIIIMVVMPCHIHCLHISWLLMFISTGSSMWAQLTILRLVCDYISFLVCTQERENILKNQFHIEERCDLQSLSWNHHITGGPEALGTVLSLQQKSHPHVL